MASSSSVKRSLTNGHDTEKPVKSAKLESPQVDSDYYFEDGDIFLLVEGILFKVHRFLLTRDGSAFADILTLPPRDSIAEGTSSTNPIRIPGDTANEFRTLLWALYATPVVVRADIKSKEAFLRMIDVAHITNKYGFRSYEAWAVQALNHHVKRRPSELPVTSESFERLLTVARDCSIDDLYGSLLLKRRNQITSLAQGRNPGIAETLLMAERTGLLGLQGFCYYKLMLLGDRYWQREKELTTKHITKLLTGFHKFTLLSHELPNAIADMISTACQIHVSDLKYICDSVYTEVQFMQIQVADVMEKMAYIETRLLTVIPKCNSAECANIHSKLLTWKLKFEDMDKYFVDMSEFFPGHEDSVPSPL